VTEHRSRTSLTPHAASMRDPDPEGAHRLAAEMWHRDGSIVIRAESKARMNWQDRELLDAIGTRIYGPRGK